MLQNVQQLSEQIQEHLKDKILTCVVALNELTVTLPSKHLREVCLSLQKAPFEFDTLIDVCGVDYLQYGKGGWETYTTTETGFSRAVSVPLGEANSQNLDFPTAAVEGEDKKSRYAAVYHLLSVAKNQRIRLRVFCDTDSPSVDSVTDIWASADWFEREAFDLFGIVFKGHPDLRRILTDYGFIGHPFRKDFPLIGEVEMRYDAAKQRCVYEPVSIQPRTLVPKVIREDHARFHPLSPGTSND